MCAEQRRPDAANEIGDAGALSLALALEKMASLVPLEKMLRLSSLDLRGARLSVGEA